MKNSYSVPVVLLVAVVMFFVGRSTVQNSQQLPTIETAAVPTKIGAETLVSAAPASIKEPELTPEQIARNKEIWVAVKAGYDTNKDADKNLPKWVADIYKTFEAQGYTRDKTAFQRSFGWGTGTYMGKPFFWFAHTNTDAWLQFDMNVILGKDAVAKIEAMKDDYGHPGEVHLVTAENREDFIAGAVTWMGITNSWTDKNCIQPSYGPCDSGKVLDDTVADLNKNVPALNLVIKGKFPW